MWDVCWVHAPGYVGDVLGASLLQLIVQMDDLYAGVYLFCGEATSGDLLFPGVAEFFTLLHIPGTIFHPRTPNPQTDLFTGSLPVHIHPLTTHARTHAYVLRTADAPAEIQHTRLDPFSPVSLMLRPSLFMIWMELLLNSTTQRLLLGLESD